MHDVPSDVSAFGHRDASFATVIADVWQDAAEDEPDTRWIRDHHAAIAPHSQAEGAAPMWPRPTTQ